MVFEKKSKISIVIPEKATPREIFASEELKKYIKKITGTDLEIINDKTRAEKNLILIGGSERNRVSKKYITKAEFNDTITGPEGIFIKTYDDVLILAGNSKHLNEYERGTVYAVYEFLERFMGCSLGAYTKKGVKGGEYVPHKKSVGINDICYIKPYADVKYRASVSQYSADGAGKSYALDTTFLDWLCKNRYNYIYTWNVVYEHFKTNGMLEEAAKRGILFKVGHHDAIDTLLPQRGNKYFREHYFETHPEYYRLTEEGKRFEMVDHWGQMVLCSRNEEMINQISENLNLWLFKNPQVKIYALLNKDGKAPQCCCDKCKGYTKSENYTYMINEIAKRVKPIHPDVTINMLAYTDLWSAPEMELESNISVTEAVWRKTHPNESGLRSIGKPDGSCLAGSDYEKNLLGWKKKGANISYYDYFMGVYPGRQRYIPMADEMQSMCKRFMEKGIDGTETQMEVYNHWNNIFNFYTFGRTAYDSELSLDDNIAAFCKMFGKGGKYIAENIRYAESVLDGQCEIMTAGIYLMAHIDKERMYMGFEKALKNAENKAARNNVRLMRMAFRYSDLECRENYENDETDYVSFKHYDIPERGELLYMMKNFDSFASGDGYGIMIPVEGQDDGFTPDKWYMFE